MDAPLWSQMVYRHIVRDVRDISVKIHAVKGFFDCRLIASFGAVGRSSSTSRRCERAGRFSAIPAASISFTYG